MAKSFWNRKARRSEVAPHAADDNGCRAEARRAKAGASGRPCPDEWRFTKPLLNLRFSSAYTCRLQIVIQKYCRVHLTEFARWAIFLTHYEIYGFKHEQYQSRKKRPVFGRRDQ